MKLHLPNGLRKALLACLATLALPAALPSTLCTASGVAALSYLIGAQAHAAIDPAGDVTWSTDISITEKAATDTYAAYDATQDTKYTFGTELEAVENGFYDFTASSSTAPKVYFTGEATTWTGLNLKGAFSAVYMNANGRLNIGEVNKEIKDIYVYGGAQFWVNKAALSDLTANFHLGAGTGSYWGNVFNGTPLALEKSVSTTGYLELLEDSQIVVCGGATLSFGGAAQAGGKTLHLMGYESQVGTLELKDGGTFGSIVTTVAENSNETYGTTENLTLSVTGGTLILQNGGQLDCALSFSNSANLTLGGKLTTNGAVSGTIGTLTLQTGAEWAIGGGGLTVGTVDASASGGKLQISIGSSGELDFDSITGKLTISLTGVTGEEFQLFNAEGFVDLWSSFNGSWQSYIEFDLGEQASLFNATLTEQGKVTFTSTAATDTWNQGSGNDPATWSTDAAFGEHGNFTAGEPAIFGDSGSTNVQLGSAISTSSMQVTRTGYTFSDAGNAEYTLTVNGDLTLADGTNTTFDVATTVHGSLVGGNSTAATVTLGKDMHVGALSGKLNFACSDTAMEQPVFLIFDMDAHNYQATEEFTPLAEGQSLGAGVGLGISVKENGTIIFRKEYEIFRNTDLMIAGGTVQFDGAEFELKSLHGAGKVIVATAGETNNRWLSITGGGKMTGQMELSTWGGQIILGDDLEIGGLVRESVSGGRAGQFKSALGATTLTLNTTTDANAAGLWLGSSAADAVNLVKKGSATQTLTSNASDDTYNSTHLWGDVTVQEGLLVFAGSGTTVVEGNVTVENASVGGDDGYSQVGGLKIDGATEIKGKFDLTGNAGLYNHLTLLGGGKVSGTLHVAWAGSHLTLGDDLEVGNLGRGTAASNATGQVREIDRAGSVTDHNVYILFSEEGGNAGDLSTMYDAFGVKGTEIIGEGVGYGIAGKAEDSNLTLSLATTSETGYDFKIRGGQVTLEGGTALTVGTADTKKTLELVGATLVLGEHTLSAGTLIVGGESKISLTMGGQTAGVLSLTGLSIGEGGSLTIQLADITAGETHDDFLLFGGGDVSSWLTDVLISKFSFVDSNGAAIDNVTLGTDGTLTWEAAAEVPEGGVFWGGGTGETELTWGVGGNNFDSDANGGGEVGWTDKSDVHFVTDNANDHTVKLASDIGAGAFEAKGSGGDKAKFSFVSSSEGTPHNLTVGNGLTAENAELSFSKDVHLDVTGDVTLTNSTLTLYSDMVFTGSISGNSGQVLNGNAQQPAMASAYAAAGVETVYALWANGAETEITWQTFKDKYGSGVLGDGVGYGVSLTDSNLTVTDAADLDRSLKAEGDGKSLTFAAGLTVNEGGSLVVGDNTEIIIVPTFPEQGNASLKGTATSVSVTHAGTEAGTGTITLDLSGGDTKAFDAADVTFGTGVKLHIKGTAKGANESDDNWNDVSNVNVLGELVVEGQQVVLRGTNTIAKLTVQGEMDKLCFDGSHTSTTITDAGGLTLNAVLDLRNGTLEVQKGTLTLTQGVIAKDTQTATLSALNLTLGNTSTQEFTCSTLTVTETLTMNGSGQQTIVGNTSMSVGTLAVQQGTLIMGSTGKAMTVTSGLNITGGTFKWAGGEMTVSGGAISSSGTFEIVYSEGVKLSWSNVTIDTSGITLTLTGFTDASIADTGYALFGEAWQDSWKDLIRVEGTTTDGNKQLTLDTTNGHVVEMQFGDALYWPGGGTDTELAWGGSDSGNEWASDATGAASKGWTDNSPVYLGATKAVTVQLKDATINAASINFYAGNAADDGGYTFTNATGGASVTLNVGSISNFAGDGGDDDPKYAVRATFDTGVNVHVTGNFSNKSAQSYYTFKEKLFVDGTLTFWGAGTNTEAGSSVMTLEKGGEIGVLDASWAGKFVLGADLVIKDWIFADNYGGARHEFFERLGGVQQDVYVDVRKTMTINEGAGETETEYVGFMEFHEGVGLKATGSGIVLTLGDNSDNPHPWNIGGSLAVADGGKIIVDSAATLGTGVNIGSDSTIEVAANKSITADSGSLKGTGGTLALGAGAKATFGSVDASAGLTGLQLAAGANLVINGAGKLDIGTLTLTDAAGITLSGADGGSIKLGNAINGDFTLTITLTGLTEGGDLLTSGYQLFTTDTPQDVLTALQGLFGSGKLDVDVADVTYDVKLGTDGKLTFSVAAPEITHTGTGSTFTWDTTSNTWDGQATFADGGSVKFTGTGANTVQLATSGVTNVKNMTVETTGGGVYTFEASSDNAGATLRVGTALNLESAAVFKLGTTVEGKMTGAGALTVDGVVFTLSDSGQAHAWSGELTVQNAGEFGLAGTVTATKLTVGTGGGKVNFSGTDAVLTVSGDIVGGGNALEIAGGGKLNWTGSTGALGSAVVGGEFAMNGGTLTMGGDIELGSSGKLSGSGNINKKDGAEKVYVSFEIGTEETVSNTTNVETWLGGKLGEVALGEGVSLRKTGDAKLHFQDGGGTLNYALDIAAGSVQFSGNAYTLNGAVTGAGNLIIATADQNNTNAVTLTKGGNLTGELQLSTWGARLNLGADTEVGGITALDGTGLTTSEGENGAGGRYRTIASSDGGTHQLIDNVASGEKTVDGLVVEAGVTFVKTGDGTQTLTTSEAVNEKNGNGKTNLKGEVQVNAGTLAFSGAGSTISGALSGEGTDGTLKLTSGDLTISGGGKHGGTLELASGTLTVSTEALTVGTLNLTGASSLDVQSDLAISNVTGSAGLTSLSLAAGSTLTVSAGNFTIGGTWTWGAGSKIILGANVQTITLGSNLNIPGGSATTQLTIDLSSDFLGDGTTKGDKQLFTSGFKDAWVDYFTFLVDGGACGVGNYENLKLDTNGKLTWGKAAEPGEVLYWGGGSNDGNVTLGTASDNEWSHVQGSPGSEAWAQGKEVVLEAASGDIKVTVGEGAEVSALEITAGATYTFTAEGAKTLTVTNGITIGANAKFGENVGVTAGKLTIGGANTVVEFSGAEGSVNVKGTLKDEVSNGKVTAVTGDGGIVLKDGATLRLTSDVINGEENYAYVQGDGTVDIDMSGDRTGAWDNWFGNLFPAVEYNKSTGSGITLQLTNSTHLTLEGHLGDRLQNVKTFNITDGSSVIVTENVGGSDLFSLGEGHTLSITGAGKDGAGALHFDAAETIAWNFVLTGDATIFGTAATTLTGELDAATYTLTKSGAGELVLGTGFSTKEGSSGTLNVTAGTLKLNYGTSEALSGYAVQLGNGATMESSITGAVKSLTASGGTLNVSGGRLTLTGGISGSLTELTLGDNATLEVTSGSGFTIASAWHWGTGSTLKLGAAVTLGESVDITDGSTQKLTIDLSSSFLGGDGTTRGEKQLFTGFKAGWEGYFTFLVDSREFDADYYEDLQLDTTGKLTWGGEEGPVEPGPGGDTEPGGDVFWGGGENESELTWGDTSHDFDSQEDGGSKKGWTPGSDVHFVSEDAKERDVKLAGDIEAGSFEAKGTGEEGKAKFSFGFDGDENCGLTVGKDMTVTRVELEFGSNVKLTVSGDLSMTDSTLSVEGEAEFKGEVSGTGTLDTGESGRISLNRTGEGGFKGKVTGKGMLATAESGQVTLAGDVSGFEGTLDIGTGGTLTLSGEAVGDEVNVKAGGSGTLAVESAESGTYFTGSVGTGDDSLTLTNTGAGMLYVGAGAESAAGAKLNGGKGGITLGNASTRAQWNGKEVTGGDITLSNVTLAEGGLKKTASEAKVYVDTALAAEINAVAREATPQGGIVDVAGMDAGDLDGIKVNAHGQLTGVTGTYKVSADKQLTLHFTAENVGEEAAGLIDGQKDFRVEFSGKGEAAEQGLHLEFDEAAIIEALRKGGEGEALNLRALENGTWDAEEKGVTIDWTQTGLMDIVVDKSESGFTSYGLRIKGSTRDLYVVLDGEKSDPAKSETPADLAEKLATVVTAGQTLTLNWAGSGTVRNLVGAGGAKLEINDASGQGLTVTLDNTHYDTVHDDRYPTTEDAKGEDTIFAGAIDGGKGVDIVKSGLGTLTVGGDYALADGDTRLEAGALRLRGAGNRMSSLTFAYGAAPGADEERGLLLAAGSRTEIGSIVEAADAVNTEGNEVTLSDNAELTLTGTSTLANTAISSVEAHSGVLHLREGASLSFTGDKGIGGTAVDMQNATLDLGKSKSTLTELSGSGTLKSAAGGEVTVGGGSFTGTLGSSVEGAGAGTLVVADGASFTLDNAKSVASAPEQGMDVRLEGKSHLTVNVGGKQGDGTDTLNFGDIELGGGQLTVDFGGRGINEKYVTGNVTGVSEGGVLEFVSNGTVKDDTIHTGFTVEEGLRGQEKLKEFVQFSGVDNLLNDHTVGVTEEGEVVLTLQAVEKNRLAELIPGAQKNGMAGAEMMWGSLKGRSQGELLSDIFARPDSAYARLAFYLSQCYESKNADGLDRTLAAAAGSAISTLGAALGQDVHRQLSTIRNRTTGMGGAAHEASDKLPQWHAWIQGEGNYHKLDADGLAPGYTLNSWGGTVGVDADVTRRMTVGLAVTAMYGDLKPDSPDSATGDLDTAYLSAFARVAHGAWIHTFALSGGFADVKLDRTVSYNGGSYRTSGSTDGYALGVLYEVGYTRLMNAAGTVALQPVFNVEWRHASIDGYTESGCDAGVSTDDITQDVVTFGAGARAQFAVGANVFNHAAVLETRALVKADVGDRSGTASNAMVGDTARAEVESAEVGAVGVELGAGISVPIGSDTGSVFVDGSVEFRSGWTSATATVGYRMNF